MIHFYIFLSLVCVGLTFALQQKGFLDVVELPRFWKSALVLLPVLLLIILFQNHEWYFAPLYLIGYFIVARVVAKFTVNLIVPGRVGDFGNYVPGGGGKLKRSYMFLEIFRGAGLIVSWIIGLFLVFIF